MIEKDFYIGVYIRESQRRYALDKSLNFPVLILTLIISLIFYIIEEFDKVHEVYIKAIVLFILLVGVAFLLFCIMFLMKSYNNILFGFNYPDLPPPTELRLFEINCKKNKIKQSEIEEDFIENINCISDQLMTINDQRSYDLYFGKKLLIILLILTIIALTIIQTYNLF